MRGVVITGINRQTVDIYKERESGFSRDTLLANSLVFLMMIVITAALRYPIGVFYGFPSDDLCKEYHVIKFWMCRFQ